LEVTDYDLNHHTSERGQVECTTTIIYQDEERKISGRGNGPINAFVNALEGIGLKDFKVTDYRSHAVRGGSDASAAAYVQLQADDGRLLWGAGIDPSIEMAGLRALVSAWNLLHD
jgi:2-isopropylmalate synthase